MRSGRGAPGPACYRSSAEGRGARSGPSSSPTFSRRRCVCTRAAKPGGPWERRASVTSPAAATSGPFAPGRRSQASTSPRATERDDFRGAWSASARSTECCPQYGRAPPALRRDPGPQHLEELRDPVRVRRPGWSGDEVLVGHRLVDGDVRVLAAGGADFGRTGRIRRDHAPAHHVGGGEDLGRVADRRERLVRLREVADAVEHLLVEPEVLGGPASGDEKGVIIAQADVVENRVEREVVSSLLGVGLIALEVVDGGAGLVSLLLAGADGIHRMPDGLKCLERHHDLVVLAVVSDQHQDLLGHGFLRASCGPRSAATGLYSAIGTESTDSRGADEFAASGDQAAARAVSFRRTLRVFCTRATGSPCKSSTVTSKAGLIFPLASVSARICSTRSRGSSKRAFTFPRPGRRNSIDALLSQTA